ncbi:MAG: tRNA pseudouridine(38-40) synthase TruA [Bacillota bacterium]
MNPDLKTCLKKRDWKALKAGFHASVALRTPSGKIIRGKEEVLDALNAYPWPEFLDFERYENIHVGYYEDHLAVKIKYKADRINRFYMAILDPGIRRIRLDCAYDGTLYHGFQRQKGKPTIQGSIESVLKHITQESITITPAGRTDRGVHAHHQVIHFDTKSPLEPDRMKRLLNQMLPKDISVLKSEHVPRLFHARFDARMKTYHYTITKDRDPFMAHYAWVKPTLDVSGLNATLALYIGEHDFSAFGKGSDSDRSTRTILNAEAFEHNGVITVKVESEGFLRHMVRTMVGTAVRDLEKNTHEVEKALKDPRKGHVYLAPATGLTLHEVKYGY